MSPQARSTSSSTSLTRQKRRAFLLITFLFPILFFGFAELLLRAVHYGPDLSLFRMEAVHGKRYFMMNPEVSQRYFSNLDFHPSTSTQLFQRPKPEKITRVFVLGASTTVGYPYWYTAAFSTFLQAHLSAAFPERTIEVLNLGMTATNSFTVLDIAEELAHESPDLIVVYGGHNEFYGALGVASRESFGKSRFAALLSLHLVHWRTYILLRTLAGAIRRLIASGRGGSDHATMMEQMAARQLVPYGSPDYHEGVESFRKNVQETCRLCESSGIPLIYCTQVSNLRDLPPFASAGRPDLTPEVRTETGRLLDEGEARLRAGSFEEARVAFHEAIIRDTLNAEAHFRLANALDSLHLWPQAREEYQRSRDCDPVRFRASDDINAVIRNLQPPTISVDVESTFAAASPEGLIGDSLITEHVHPNERGQFLIAESIVKAMKAHGVWVPSTEWAQRDTLPGERFWEQRPTTPLDERIAERKTEIVTSGWPFHQRTIPLAPVAETDTLGQIAELVVRGRWSWERAHEAALVYAETRSDHHQEAAEYRALLAQLPLDQNLHARYGAFLASISRVEEAKAEFQKSLSLEGNARAYCGMGNLQLARGELQGATASYRAALLFAQPAETQAETRFLLGLAYLKGGNRKAAANEFRESLHLAPANRHVRAMLDAIEHQERSREGPSPPLH